MQKFKLKDNAIPFFDYQLKRKVQPIDFWKENHVSELALEAVDNVFITYGIKTSDISSSLSQWTGEERMGQFHFTLNITDMESKDYNILSKDEVTMTKLMSEIQSTVSDFVERL